MPPARSSPLSARIARAMWVVTAASILAAVILTGILLVRSHRDSVRRQLESTASALISLGISDFEDLENFDALSRFIEKALGMERVDKIVRIYTSTGHLAFSTARLEYDRLPFVLPQLSRQPFFLPIKGLRRNYESLVIPYQTFGRRRPFYLQIAIPLPSYTELFEHLWWQSLILLGILMGLALLLSRRLARRLLRPVDAISFHLENMDPTRVEEWSPLDVKDAGPYLEAIVGRINSMSERTRAAVLQIRKMGRYVAHELRTPLTILQGEAETVLGRPAASKEDYEAVLKSSLEEIQRMSEIVRSVLQVGEWERSDVKTEPVPCDLSGWVREMQPRWEKSLGRSIEISAPETGPQVLMDQRMTDHLVDNLVRNVRKHAGGSLCRIRVSQEDGEILLTVSDDGPGMPPGLIETLGRGEPILDVPGVGLNLCQKIAKICGLTIRFANRSSGGLDAEILFPSADRSL